MMVRRLHHRSRVRVSCLELTNAKNKTGEKQCIVIIICHSNTAYTLFNHLKLYH